jgi:hypothetical protein
VLGVPADVQGVVAPLCLIPVDSDERRGEDVPTAVFDQALMAVAGSNTPSSVHSSAVASAEPLSTDGP